MLALITHVGDSSTLILDPDLDTYYLMDLTTVAIPGSMQHFDAVLAKSAAAPQDARSTTATGSRCTALTALLQANDAGARSASGRTALRSDPDFYGTSESLQRRLPPALESHGMALLELLARVAPAHADARRGRAAGRVRAAASQALTPVTRCG